MSDKKEINVEGDMDLSGDLTFGNKIEGDSYSASGNIEVTRGDKNVVRDVGDGATVVQGSNNEVLGSRAVKVGGSVSGHVVSGDGNVINDAALEAINKLLAELLIQLKQAPAENKEEAQVVAHFAEQYKEQTTAEKPNKTIASMTAESLQKAAENIKAVMPAVVTIALQMIAAGQKLLG